MATPRVTIDQLPEQAAPEDTNYFVVQDSGVSKKMSWATIAAQPSIPLNNHINLATDAHDASAISTQVSGTGVDATHVQGQLAQLTTLVNDKLNQTVADGLYVNITGDGMTGPLVVQAPTLDGHAATKLYVDQAVIDAGGGITQPDADARYVNVTGDTMTGDLVVPLLTCETGVVLPAGEPSAANRAARRDWIDANYVAQVGDTMTGRLNINVTGMNVPLILAADSNLPKLAFYKSDLTTLLGQIGISDVTGNTAYNTVAGGHYFQTNGVSRAWVSATQLRSTVSVYCEGQVRGSQLYAYGVDAANCGFYNAASAVDSMGALGGYVGFATGNDELRLFNNIAGAPIVLYCGASEKARVNSAGHLLVGKTAADNYGSAGNELRANGTIIATVGVASDANYFANHLSGADANGQIYMTFRRTTSGTQIGSISQVNTTGVAFNTTSHGPWKGNVEAITDADAIDTIMQYMPVSFQWKLDPNGTQTERGTPRGPVERGFIAQDHEELAPFAVTPAHGEEWQSDFTSAQFDYGRITPDLVAAIQALVRRVEALEGAAA